MISLVLLAGEAELNSTLGFSMDAIPAPILLLIPVECAVPNALPCVSGNIHDRAKVTKLMHPRTMPITGMGTLFDTTKGLRAPPRRATALAAA